MPHEISTNKYEGESAYHSVALNHGKFKNAEVGLLFLIIGMFHVVQQPQYDTNYSFIPVFPN